MLSVANPPNPPCSCKVLASSSDEKGHPSERPSSSPEADPAGGPDEAQHPSFSIRDYAFASRSKDIENSWPFPQQYLQLCVKHGVRDLLPPFEPPDLVRARFSEKCVAAEHLLVCSEVLEGNRTEVPDAVKHGFSQPTGELVLGSSHQRHNLLSEDKSAVVRAVGSEGDSIHGEAESKVTGHAPVRSIPSSVSRFPGSVQETRSTVSESSSEVEAAKPLILAEKFGGYSEPSVKKCRLIVKFGSAPEPNRTEDIASNLCSVLDPMASKVCPVCKTFSSTSNTTLNAHIDQCLSAESSAKWDTTKLSQHTIKPRKKRSMEDICATAPRCTLEDLDRRNGTNWALDLTGITQNNESSCATECKQPRISPLKVTGDEREGAVYVDSNGTKLLILSKFIDAQSAASVGYSGPKKCISEFKNRSSPFGKKKCFPPKYRKYLKAKVQRNKMGSSSHLKGEIRKEGKLHVDTHHKEGRISQASHDPEQIKSGKPGTLGHWMCSKRSSLLKHMNRKSSHRKPRNPLAITHHKSMEGDQSSCDYFVTGGPVKKCCKSSDEVLSPPKTRKSDTVLTSLNQGKYSANSLEKSARSIGNKPSTSNSIMLKLSKSTGKCISSAKSKRLDMHANAVQTCGKFRSLKKTSVDCHLLVHKANKGSRRSLLMDGPECRTETVKRNKVVQGVVSKKLRKRRFAEKHHKAIENLPLELAEGFHCSIAHGLGSISHNVTSRTPQSNFSENVVRPRTTDAFHHVSPCQHNTMGSNQADVYCLASEGEEYLTLNHSQLEAECRLAEATKFNAQIEMPANMDSVVKYPWEKSVGACGSKLAISEDHQAYACDRLNSCLSLEHQREPSGANKATIAVSLPKLLGDQRMCHGVIATDVVRPDIWHVGLNKSSVKDGYCSELQNMEYEADVASIQGSSSCLTRPEDKVLELAKCSSVTSGRTVTAGIHNMTVGGEPSGSAISATSTISNLSVEDLKFKDAEREPSEEPVVVQEKLRPACRNFGFLADDSVRGTERTDLVQTTQKVKATTFAQEPEKVWDGQPCCCSQRESIPHDSQILRQTAMAGMMLPTKTKHITSPLYARPVISSSGTYSHLTTEAKAIPILDSPTDSISAKASPNFAMGFPTYSGFGLASPSSHIYPQNTSSPILRLMGKNLMVINEEERPVQQQNQTSPCSSEGTSNAKYMSLLGFSSTCGFSNLDGIPYHAHRHLESSMLVGQHPPNFQKARQEGKFIGCVQLAKESSKAASNVAPSGIDVRRVGPFLAISTKCFSVEGAASGLEPAFPISCPRRNSNCTKLGSTSESSDPLLPRHFVVPSHSAGQLPTTPPFSGPPVDCLIV